MDLTKNIVVVGAGVIGMTVAIKMLEQNYSVTIISKDEPFATNSDAAVATWHPPSNRRPLLQKLCLASLPKFKELSQVKGSGVRWVSIVKYMKNKSALKENPWLKQVMGPQEIPQAAIESEQFPFRLMVHVPLADVNIYRPFLYDKFKKLGGKFEQRKISNFDELDGKFDAIINCAGWETKFLLDDKRVHPIRGQTVTLEVPTSYKDPISFSIGHLNAYATFRPESLDCVIGTTYKVNDSKTAISEKEKEDIIAKVSKFFPDLKNLKIKQDKVGLRCGRWDVCIKSQWLNKSLIAHCYGHNSSGFSASWASADEVLKLCDEELNGKPKSGWWTVKESS